MARKVRQAGTPPEYYGYIRQMLDGPLFLPIASHDAAERLRTRLHRLARRIADEDSIPRLKRTRTQVRFSSELMQEFPQYQTDPLQYPYTLILDCTSDTGTVIGQPFQPAAGPVPLDIRPLSSIPDPINSPLDTPDMPDSLAEALAYLSEDSDDET